MTKADIVLNISDDLGIDRADVQATVEKFMKKRGKCVFERIWKFYYQNACRKNWP